MRADWNIRVKVLGGDADTDMRIDIIKLDVDGREDVEFTIVGAFVERFIDEHRLPSLGAGDFRVVVRDGDALAAEFR